jgi:hypothetical protein
MATFAYQKKPRFRNEQLARLGAVPVVRERHKRPGLTVIVGSRMAAVASNKIGFVFQRSCACSVLILLVMLAALSISAFVRAHLYLRGRSRSDLHPATSGDRRAASNTIVEQATSFDRRTIAAHRDDRLPSMNCLDS